MIPGVDHPTRGCSWRYSIRLFARLALCFLVAGSLGWASQDEVATLVGELRARLAADRAQAAYGLAELGGAAAEGTAALVVALRDSDRYVRHAAAYALGEIGRGDAAVEEALRRAMRNRDRFLRVQAALAMARLTAGGEASGFFRSFWGSARSRFASRPLRPSLVSGQWPRPLSDR